VGGLDVMATELFGVTTLHLEGLRRKLPWALASGPRPEEDPGSVPLTGSSSPSSLGLDGPLMQFPMGKGGGESSRTPLEAPEMTSAAARHWPGFAALGTAPIRCLHALFLACLRGQQASWLAGWLDAFKAKNCLLRSCRTAYSLLHLTYLPFSALISAEL